MKQFRIYYDDLPPYDGDVWNAPGLGVLIIVEPDPDSGHRFVMGGDYYIWRDDRWWEVDFMGLTDYLLQPGKKKVLFGRTVTNEHFKEIYQRADNDPDFPVRTNYTFLERKHTK